MKKILICLTLPVILLSSTLSGQQITYTFTTANSTGSLGPSQTQINTAYSSGNLNGSVTVTNGIQSFTIPSSGLYAIEAFGSSGGNRTNSPQHTGGFGAYVRGEFNFVQGDVITILVGQKGVDGANTAGGGGGTFVEKNNVLLIAAGAGGGATGDNNAADASLTTSGTNDYPGGTIPGGTSGGGGGACSGSGANHGGGGGGYLGDGAISTGNNAAGGGLAFVNGGTGGASAVPGAFGGGGGATNSGAGLYGGGGGGGGYSGGAGGQQVNHCTPGIDRSGGGGGGSYNTGSNPTSSVLTTQGDGQVILTSLCNIALTASSNSVCEGQSIQLSTDAASGILWNTGATTNTITVTPSVTTTYSVSGTSTANCNASSALEVIVHPLPAITAISSPSVVCVGQAGTLVALGAPSYTWSSTQTGSNVVINPAIAGNYTVTGESAEGCTNTAVVNLNVNTNSLTVTSGTQVCEGREVTLGVSGAETYTWSTGAIFSTLQFTTDSPGTYTVYGTDIHNCVLSGMVSVGILPNPVVSAKATPASICKGETSLIEADGAGNYTWNTGITSSSFEITPMVDVTMTYTVTGTDGNGCSSKAIVAVQVNKCVGISEEQFTADNVIVFPNPTKGLVTLQIKDQSRDLELRILNNLGTVVSETKLDQHRKDIDLSALPAGLYHFMLLENQKELGSVRVIKE